MQLDRSWKESELITRLARHSGGRKILSLVGPRYIEKNLGAFTLLLDLQDRWGVSKYILRHGNYDPDICEMIEKTIAPGAVCLDIGANIGFWSNFLATKCKAKTVIAIEPEPENFALLQYNVELNRNQSKVKRFNCAVGAEPSKLKLFLSKDNAGDHQLYASGESRESVEVDVKRVDDLVGDQKIDFIKMDVQGYEPFVLQGMTELFERNSQVKILTEFWPKGIRAAGADPEEMLKFFTHRKFRFHFFNESRRCWQESDAVGLLRDLPEGHHIDLLMSRSQIIERG